MGYDNIKKYLEESYKRMFSEPIGKFKHKSLLPVAFYATQL